MIGKEAQPAPYERPFDVLATIQAEPALSETAPFAPNRIAAMRASYAPASLLKGDLLSETYLLAQEGRYSVYYAALGAYPLATNSLILVGLTPGLTQTAEAARLFAATPPAIRENPVAYDALLRKHVAFKGSMRKNLCTLLDALGLPKWLRIASSDVLFDDACNLAATTSALVYPVFTGSDLRNFSGNDKGLAAVRLFREMLEKLLAPRIAAAPGALVVPLGKAASSGVRYLIDTGALSRDRVLEGFPHASGANGHRKRQFDERREALTDALRVWGLEHRN